jgi:plastocyanin
MRRGVWHSIILATGLATAAGGEACQSAVETLPLDVHVDLSRTSASPGDTVSAVTTAQGATLLGITIDFGDGAGDSYGTSGARTAKVTFKHAYKAPGTYTVSAVATDGVAGQKTTSVQLRIN